MAERRSRKQRELIVVSHRDQRTLIVALTSGNTCVPGPRAFSIWRINAGNLQSTSTDRIFHDHDTATAAAAAPAGPRSRGGAQSEEDLATEGTPYTPRGRRHQSGPTAAPQWWSSRPLPVH